MFPYDVTQWNDTDGDGYGGHLSRIVDTFPLGQTQWNGTYGDGYGDNISCS